MTRGKNKIKYNLKNVHYAELMETEGKITWGTPVAVPGAVSLSLDAEGDTSIFYADGVAYYVSVTNNGYSGDLEMALVPDGFRTDILGDTKDTKNVITENADVTVKSFALLFQFDGDANGIRHVLYNCKATRPTIESETKEDTIEPKTETLSLTASPLADGRVKAKTTDETDETTYNGWFNKVYEATAAEA